MVGWDSDQYCVIVVQLFWWDVVGNFDVNSWQCFGSFGYCLGHLFGVSCSAVVDDKKFWHGLSPSCFLSCAQVIYPFVQSSLVLLMELE